MAIIREPDGVEFTVVPTRLTAKDRREISKSIVEHRRQHDHSATKREAKRILRQYDERQQSRARGLIREPEGVDFIIQSKPLTPKDVAEISEFIRNDREARAKARAMREKLEAKALTLPSAERTQLAYQLLRSLAADETDESQREWASAAKVEFEHLHSSCPPMKVGKKPARRTKSSKA